MLFLATVRVYAAKYFQQVKNDQINKESVQKASSLTVDCKKIEIN